MLQRLRAIRDSFARLIGRSGPQAGAADISHNDKQLVFRLSKSRIPTWRQLRHLSAVLSPVERRWMRWFSLTAVIALIVLSISFFGRHLVSAAKPGGTLTEGLVGTPQYINPVLAQGHTVDGELTGLLFRGLTRVDAEFAIVNDLAETIDRSADGKSYTVKLRSGLKWSDDAPITSQDIKFTYDTLSDSEFKSPLIGVYQGVSVAIVDDLTVTFSLTQARSSFLGDLTLGLLPAHRWTDASAQTFALAELNVKPVGNGPFKFQSVTKDRSGNIKSYTFTRNKNFFGQEPFLDRIIVKLYPDRETAVDALRNQSIDALGGLTKDQVTEAKKKHVVTPFDVSQLTSVFFNQTNPALKAKEVRIALATTVDRDAIDDEFLDEMGDPVIGPILPGYLGYNPELKRHDYDQDAAKKILEDNGWKLNDQGIRQKGSQQLTFTFTTVDEPTYAAIADYLAEEWRRIGANVEVQKVESARIQRDILRPRRYEALLFGQLFDADVDPYPFWHSSQQKDGGFNLAIWFNKKVDDDLQDGRTTSDPEQRLRDYLDFQNIVAEEVPAIMLYQAKYAYAHPRGLRGFPSERLVSGTDRFQFAEYWYLQTRLSWK